MKVPFHVAIWQIKSARKILPLIFLLKILVDYIQKNVEIRKKRSHGQILREMIFCQSV